MYLTIREWNKGNKWLSRTWKLADLEAGAGDSPAVHLDSRTF